MLWSRWVVCPLAAFFLSSIVSAQEECTTAIITGSVTTDGRPLLWKNRDTSDHWSEVIYFSDGGFPHITLTTVHDSVNARLGVNEVGFAIVNAVSHNLGDTLTEGITNGVLMKEALRSCATVADFEALLIDTELPGRSTPANLGVIDAAGGAAYFEVDNHTHVKYDANDPVVAPDGFLVRENFSFRADTTDISTWRYHQSYQMLKEASVEERLDVVSLLDVARNLRNPRVDPYPLPYPTGPPEDPNALGFVDARQTINRSSTACFGIVRGVQSGEDPRLSTFYVAPGHPVVTIVLPVWVAAGPTPEVLDGPLGSAVSEIAYGRMRDAYCQRWHPSWINTFFLVHGDGQDGFLHRVEQVEAWLLPEVEATLESWVQSGFDPAEAADFEQTIASLAFAEYEVPVDAPAGVGSPIERELVLSCWPNPSRGETVFRVVDDRTSIQASGLLICDLSGRLVRRLMADRTRVVQATAGDRESWTILEWDGRDAAGRDVPSGVYFYRVDGSGVSGSGSFIIAR